jgi:hypothetical protein
MSRSLVFAGGILVLVTATGLAATWVETSAQDFTDGTHEDNIYVSHRGGGAVEFIPRFDLNNDSYIDLVCPDDSGPWLRVYFGSATGFDSARSRYYVSYGGGGADMADLNTDGYAELIHSGWHARHVTIYRGTDSGPSPTDTTWLYTGGQSEATTVCDLDRDSYLDIVAATDSSTIYVFWGSDTGYASSNRTVITLDGRIGHNLEVADFDRDGYLDIAAVPWTRSLNPVIYWGPGRTARNIVWLPVSDGNPHGTTVADLNRDGWLDLVFSGYDTVVTSYIYYGSSVGFSTTNRELIHPGQCYGGNAAAYWDADTSIDLIFLRGDFSHDTTMFPLVYYNDLGAAPHFSDARSEAIGNLGFNASGGFIADFDRDGTNDLFIDGYSAADQSAVLWGPDWTRRDRLPSGKSHHGVAREPGNDYDRRFHEAYLSSVFGGGDTMVWQRITWDDTAPEGASIELATRTGSLPVPDPSWSDWLAVANGDSIPDSLASRYIQYQATFRYETPAVLPELYEVRLDYGPLPVFDVGPFAILAPTGTVDSGTVIAPAVAVANFGNEDVEFPVTVTIGADYSQTMQETLAAGLSDTVLFPAWLAQPLGWSRAACYTSLTNDRNRHNDTIADSVRVIPLPPHDVGAVAILSPKDSLDSGTVVTPRAAVRNFGTWRDIFPVTMTIGSSYATTVEDTLDPGASDTVSFPDWVASLVGPQAIVCYTQMPGDGDPHNDTVRSSVKVLRLPVSDVGCAEILAPRDFADTGTAIAPVAVIHNYGAFGATFPVTMQIGTSYSATIQETLASFRTDTVSFPDWVASPIDTVNVICFTALPGDPNPSNDTCRIQVVVEPPGTHDVGTVAILWPNQAPAEGDTVQLKALVRNYGRRSERYFDVRFRIGTVYNRTVSLIAAIPPDSTIEARFPDWVASPGTYIVSCSTMLTMDIDHSNDKRTLNVTVTRPFALTIYEDQTDRIEAATHKTYYFHARLEGGTGAIVDLDSLVVPGGWGAELYDSTETSRLHNSLGRLEPNLPFPFALRVQSPSTNLSGAIDTGATRVLAIRGFVREDTTVTDEAFLRLTLVPQFAIHNYPNPLEDSTTFVIGLPVAGNVSLTIYNRAGERIKRVLQNVDIKAGVVLLGWNATNDAGHRVASGTYRYILDYVQSGINTRIAKKLVVIRK